MERLEHVMPDSRNLNVRNYDDQEPIESDNYFLQGVCAHRPGTTGTGLYTALYTCACLTENDVMLRSYMPGNFAPGQPI